METSHDDIRLTSSELACLWNSYMADSMFRCVLKYFIAKVEDHEIRPVLVHALEESEKHVFTIIQIFNQEKIPVPQGFINEDVNVDAPRLFSDTFFLNYLFNMGKNGLVYNSMALSISARADVYDFYNNCLKASALTLNMARKVLLSKGLYIRPPYIPVPEKVDFTEKYNFFHCIFGKPRPLLAIEITHLFMNIQNNSIGKALIMGFSQVAKLDETRKYFLKGKDIAAKHVEVFSATLRHEEIPAPTTWDGDVMASREAPFSDKLMMAQIVSLCSAGVGNYGASIAASPRHDLAADYARLMTETGKYGEEGAQIMIDHEWLEQPPQAVDREALTAIRS